MALGLVAKTVETASNMPMFLILLPFLGSGFVPTDTMPAGLRWFAEYQPFTPIIETLRGLLMGTPIGNDGLVAIAWCAGIALLSYSWAKRLLARRPVPPPRRAHDPPPRLQEPAAGAGRTRTSDWSGPAAQRARVRAACTAAVKSARR